ncbi:MAG: sugar phosphate isomerase/epimerase [Lachnospiraceae bacterium]|nr:sugar phosphate isomerase/epimerase [Lachnospiraceae bacterium]
MERWMNQGTTLCYHDVEKDITYCHKYHFEAIELKYSVIKDFNLDKLKQLLENNQVRVGALGALCLPVFEDIVRKQQMERKLDNMCQIAVEIECEYIVLIPPRGKMKKEIKEDFEIISLFQTYLAIAERYGLKLAFEVTGFEDSLVNTFQRGLMLTRTLSSKNIGLILDFYHFFSGGMKYNELLEAKADEIFIVHANDGVKNRDRRYLDEDRFWPGEGDFQISELIDILQRINYSGPISIEVYQRTGWKTDIEYCYQNSMLKMNELLGEKRND